MVKLLEGPRKEARQKGIRALAAWVGSGAVSALVGFGLGSPGFGAFLGLVGGAFAALLTWRWFKHRSEWGLKF